MLSVGVGVGGLGGDRGSGGECIGEGVEEGYVWKGGKEGLHCLWLPCGQHACLRLERLVVRRHGWVIIHFRDTTSCPSHSQQSGPRACPPNTAAPNTIKQAEQLMSMPAPSAVIHVSSSACYDGAAASSRCSWLLWQRYCCCGCRSVAQRLQACRL